MKGGVPETAARDRDEPGTGVGPLLALLVLAGPADADKSQLEDASVAWPAA